MDDYEPGFLVTRKLNGRLQSIRQKDEMTTDDGLSCGSDFLSLTLFIFSCHQEKEQKYQLRLDGVRLRDAEAGFISKKSAFAIFNPDQK